MLIFSLTLGSCLYLRINLVLSPPARDMRGEEKRQSPAGEGWHVTPSAGTSWIPACHVSEQSEMHFQVLRDLPTEERKPLPWGGEADRHTHYKQVKRMVCSAWSELGTNQKQDPIMMPGEMWSDHTSIAMAPGNQVWAKGGASLICIKMKGQVLDTTLY